MRGHLPRAANITVRAADIALVTWIVAWLVVGVVAYVEIRDLEQLSDTLAESGTALDTAGAALETIGAIPIIGEGPERLGREVRAAAVEVQRSALETRDSVRALSVLLGMTIGVMPTVPPLAIYLPWRVARRREVAAIADGLRRHGGDAAFEEYLARRALQHIPLATLTQLGAEPWRDLQDGRARLLANAELTRLGLARPGGVEGDRDAQ